MQNLLQIFEAYTTRVEMEWAAETSCSINLRVLFNVIGQKVREKVEAFYLFVSLNHHIGSDKNLVEILQCPVKMLNALRTVKTAWKLSLRQRKTFLKTFLLVNCDYPLYFQHPTTEGVYLQN